MKLNEIALANASAIITGIVYIVCALAVAVFPGFFRLVAESWVHGIDLGLIWTGGPRDNFLVGFITAVIGTWLAGWAFAWVYNKFAK